MVNMENYCILKQKIWSIFNEKRVTKMSVYKRFFPLFLKLQMS